MFEQIYGQFSEMVAGLFSPSLRLFPLYLITTVIIAFGVFHFSNAKQSFIKWLFPKRIWLHPSSLVDFKLFLIGRVTSSLGLFNNVVVTSAIAYVVVTAFRGRPEEGEAASALLVGFCALLANDFGVYWVHRIHHETKSLWPFHSVHHSAEVMTPITVYRKHPVYDMISSIGRGCFYGLLQGLLLSLFVGPLEVTAIIGINAFYFVFNVLGSNLRHSHVWLSYGRVLEHILISPAQHQIHHSSALKHHNKNYGEVLALWDWLFGTLYIPEKQERLAFGISDEKGNSIPQPHGSVYEALVDPIREFRKELSSTEPRKEELPSK